MRIVPKGKLNCRDEFEFSCEINEVIAYSYLLGEQDP